VVPGAVQDQGGGLYGRQGTPHVDLAEDRCELDERTRGGDEPFEPCPPPRESLVVEGGRSLEVEVPAGAHLGDESIVEVGSLLFVPSPREVGRPHRPDVGRVQDEGTGALGCRGREQQGRRSTACASEHGRGLGAGGVHDRPDVVHLELDHGRFGTPVRQPDAPHVEQDQAGERGQAAEVARPPGFLPHHVEVRPDARGVHEVDRAVAHHLVGDVHVAVARVLHGALHRR